MKFARFAIAATVLLFFGLSYSQEPDDPHEGPMTCKTETDVNRNIYVNSITVDRESLISNQPLEPERFYIGSDNSGHKYIVRWDKRAEFAAWSELPADDERGWEEPEYAQRIDGGTLTFEKPEIR